MEGTRKRPWSDLPPELLSMIGTRLHTRTDVLRFRSVCASFRSSITPVRRHASQFRLRIPRSQSSYQFLRESTVYALETADGAASGPARWLLKLEESELGGEYMGILSLFSRWPIMPLPRELPRVLDCLQSRIVEICREYTLDFGGSDGGLVRKVAVHPDCAWTDLDQCSFYFIDDKRQLSYWKYGDENWSHLGWGFQDLLVYQGKVCVVNRLGSVSWVDSSFRLRRLSLPLPTDGSNRRGCRRYWKHLVVSSGDLYLVDADIRYSGTSDFRGYRLDRQNVGDGRR